MMYLDLSSIDLKYSRIYAKPVGDVDIFVRN